MMMTKSGIIVSYCLTAVSLLVGFSGVVAAEQLITENVHFNNHGVRLSGTLVLPGISSPCPALIMIDGSGPTKRNLRYAKTLAQHGIAVLTYDKRGVGASGGAYVKNGNASKGNLALLASDAVAGVDVLAHHPAINPKRIGLWAGSQGGWIAPIVASESPEVSFMVILSGPTVPVSTELKYSRFAEQDKAFFEKHSQKDIEKRLQKQTIRDVFWKLSGRDFDPQTYLESLTIPVLWIYGQQDRSVPVSASITRLKQMNKANFEIKLYPEYGHALPASDVNVFFTEWILSLSVKPLKAH